MLERIALAATLIMLSPIIIPVVIISKIYSGNVKVEPIPFNPITIRDRFRKFIGIVKYL